MIVPRRGHDCVSITTSRGEKLMAVGGLDKRNKPVKEVELFDPKTKTWTVDERRSLRYPTKKYEFYSLLSSFSGPFLPFLRSTIVTIGCKVYLITRSKEGFGAIYILTETSWKLMNYSSKFSPDMINGSFTSSPVHCSDLKP